MQQAATCAPSIMQGGGHGSLCQHTRHRRVMRFHNWNVHAANYRERSRPSRHTQRKYYEKAKNARQLLFPFVRLWDHPHRTAITIPSMRIPTTVVAGVCSGISIQSKKIQTAKVSTNTATIATSGSLVAREPGRFSSAIAIVSQTSLLRPRLVIANGYRY